jgi:chromosomal replication initiation ATPase DnaA
MMNPIDEMRVDIKDIKKILTGYIDGTYRIPKPSRRLAMNEIARVVATFFNISVRQLRSDKRIDTIILARHIAK